MSRIPAHHNVRIAATALAALGTLFAATSIAAPARADHVEGAVARHVQRVAASHLALAGELVLGPASVVTVFAPPRARFAHRHHARGRTRCRHAAHRRAHAWHDFRRGIPPHEHWERRPERGHH